MLSMTAWNWAVCCYPRTVADDPALPLTLILFHSSAADFRCVYGQREGLYGLKGPLYHGCSASGPGKRTEGYSCQVEPKERRWYDELLYWVTNNVGCDFAWAWCHEGVIEAQTLVRRRMIIFTFRPLDPFGNIRRCLIRRLAVLASELIWVQRWL
jgi:hypothetical protein